MTLDEIYEKPNIKGDGLNFILLTFLYVLQGSIVGIAEAIPIILQKRNATYEDQATFNFIWHPFSFKILWAPILDSVFWKKVGRRKSWMILTQYSTGALLLYSSMNIDEWLGNEDGMQKPNVRLLTVIFFLCMLLSSIQDIVVDGWSLTIFQKKNVTYSAVSQGIGFSFGNVAAFVSFIVLDSKDFCNLIRSVPQDRGFVTFAEFLYYLSLVFIVTVTLILIFKKENVNGDLKRVYEESNLNITKTYTLLWKIMKIRPIQLLSLFLLTRFISAAPTLTVAPLKLLDSGLTEDKLALLTIPLLPLQLFLPLLLNRYVTGSRPMHLFFIFYSLRVIFGVIYTAFIYFISNADEDSGITSTWYYWPLLVFLGNFDTLALLIMLMAVLSVSARISDPRFGGVYMTLLNSINNVGESWSSTVCLWLVDWLTIQSCSSDRMEKVTCVTIVDGFYVEVVLGTIIGALWILWVKKYIYELEKIDTDTFLVKEGMDVPVEK